MKTTDLIISRNLAGEVLKSFGLPPITGRSHYNGECPLCRKKKSIRIDNRKGLGDYICTCGTGNLFTLIQEVHGLDFKSACKEIDGLFGNTYTNDKPKQEKPRITPQEHFSRLSRMGDTVADEYLKTRGIYTTPKMVRCGRLYNAEAQRQLDAMVAVALDEYGKPAFFHTTFLDGAKKASVQTQKRLKKIEGASDGQAAIRLADQGDVMGIAEGIESALSAAQLYKMPVWAVINSGYMEKFRAPKGVKELFIFADNDKSLTGLAAAMKCGKGNLLSANDVTKVTVMWPSEYGADFNDLLQNQMQVYQWVGMR